MVGNEVVDSEGKEKMEMLVQDILSKRELSTLEPEFALPKVKRFLEQNRKIRLKFEDSDYPKFRKSKEFKAIVKDVRAELRKVYGVFVLESAKKREKLLENLKDDPSLENHDKILETHQSSKERIPIYSVVYKKIFSITSEPKFIVDLACGLNPVSYPYLQCTPRYVASDVSEKDMEFLNRFFSQARIDGKAIGLDLMKDHAKVEELCKGADVVFLFKALDSLEAIKRNSSEKLMDSIIESDTKYIVVSFATKSIGGKKDIRKEKRAWFEKMMKRKGFSDEVIDLSGETFYVLKVKG
ncbi:hypothetical protein JW711_01510 [Candidatus Woesearchaeota archaeon]|nr:hypothetical protein [Candidatus Woesearchaeota archaeon]